MKVSYKWLSDYVDLSGFTARDLAEKLTRSGIEVDVVESRNKGVVGVVVGLVKVKDKHPDADKLSVCTVDVGQTEDLQIVCGAKNVAAGQKVPVAMIGATLPDGMEIKRAKLRGVESEGMICSAKELGLNDRLLPKELQEGILVLPEATPLGASIIDVLALDDDVLELDLTPNRSDCLSMLGAAYEIAAILGRGITLPDAEMGLAVSQKQAADVVAVSINTTAQCTHYAARLVEDVQVAPAPLWLQNRLMASGIRPINNIVDIANYVMLEYGQPLHAFDADALDNGRIVVRLAHEGEHIVTLDDVTRALEPHMMLITDGQKPVAIAGVMGGKNSEVTPATTRVLLESAKFAGGSVRKTSRQLGLRSEASLRFEKEVNPETILLALNRAASLLCQYAHGKVAQGIAEVVGATYEPLQLELSLEKVNGYLGTSISLEIVQSLLDRLHFTYDRQHGAFDHLHKTYDHIQILTDSQPNDSNPLHPLANSANSTFSASSASSVNTTEDSTLIVHVPSRRGDITRDVDLIEEIARLYGYDNIPISLMSGVTTPGALSKDQAVRRAMRNLLSQSGLYEVISYTFTHPDKIKQFPGKYSNTETVALSLPMSEDRSTLRTSLIPHLLDTAVYNQYRNTPNVAIFEIGKVFLTTEQQVTELPQERLLLSILLTGQAQATHWSGKAQKVDFYDLKGMMDKALHYFGFSDIVYKSIQPVGFHPGRTAEILISTPQGEVSLGMIGQLHPEIQRAQDLEDTYILEIELDTLCQHVTNTVAYQALPRFPASSRDIAVMVAADVEVGKLLSTVKEVAGSLLESIQVFDIYTGEKLGADKKSAAISLVYRHSERTLTDEEITSLHGEVVRTLEQSFAAELRK